MQNSKYIDTRGYLCNIPTFSEHSESFISYSHKNVIRGIHISPYSKYVTVISGNIIDFIIDIKTTEYKKYNLKTMDTIYIGENMGHCFVTTEDSTLLYQLNGNYDANIDICINPFDPFINIVEFSPNYIISDKDKSANFTQNVMYMITT